MLQFKEKIKLGLVERGQLTLSGSLGSNSRWMDVHIATLEKSLRTSDQALTLLMQPLWDFGNVLVNCWETICRVKHIVTKQLPTKQAGVLSSSSHHHFWGAVPCYCSLVSLQARVVLPVLQGHSPITLQGCVYIIMTILQASSISSLMELYFLFVWPL